MYLSSYLLNWNVLGLTFLMVLAGVPAAGAAMPDGAPGWTRKTVRFSLTARNLREIKTNVERLIVYAPVSTSNQRVLNIEATQAFVQSDDALGNRLLVFTFSELAPFATKRITVSATLEVATQARAAETPVGTPFVGDEPMVESAHPEIMALEKTFGDLTAADYVARTYAWIRGNVSYAGFVADDMGALNAFTSRRGDCSEFAYLLAALNRAHGIPTKVLGGFVVPSSAVLKASDYHNWNEVYVDGKWQLVDAQKGVFFSSVDDYVVTRIISRAKAGAGDEFVHRYLNPEGGLKVEMD